MATWLNERCKLHGSHGFMKWIVILVNALAIFILFGLRQYAHGYHRVEAENVYDGLVIRGLFDEAKLAEYAAARSPWHPKERLNAIGDPSGFVQIFFVTSVGVCVFNATAILLLSRKRMTRG